MDGINGNDGASSGALFSGWMLPGVGAAGYRPGPSGS